MGYFSNGCEGDSYEARYCSNCVHQNGPDGKTGCAVWLAHMLKNYDECNNKESILHTLIPRKGIVNLKCLMFLTRDDVKRIRREHAAKNQATFTFAQPAPDKPSLLERPEPA